MTPLNIPVRIALFAGTLALAGPAVTTRLAAQATVPELDQVAAEAIRNNLRLAQEREASTRAAAGVREARARFLPSVTVESRYSEQNGTLDLGDVVNPAYAALNEVIGAPRFPTDLDLALPRQHESRVRLVQPLLDASIAAGYSLSRHARDAQRFQQRAAARRVAAEAQVAYLSVAAARSARRRWEATLELVTEGERVATRLVDAGRATPDAVFRARADRGDVEQRLSESRDEEDAAARAFNEILRRPLGSPVTDLPDSLLRMELRLTEDEAVARALVRREELAQAGASIRAADAGVRLATASFLPSIAIALDYGFQGRELRFRSSEDFAVASVVLSWNLFNGGRDLARRQGAQSEAGRARLRRSELGDLVRLEVSRAYRAAVVARDAIGTADQRLAAARRSFELVRRRYEEGLAAQVEFLDARTALTSAELNRVATVYRFAIRYVELERAAALRDFDDEPGGDR